MRTLQLLCLFIATTLFLSCKEENEHVNKIPPPEAIRSVTSKTVSGWAGVYSGTLPCGNCPGIKTSLTLKQDSTYVLSSQALTQEEAPRIFSGTFYWDKSKNTITLDAEGDHLKFLMQEGSIKKLDKFGDEEQGGPAAMYILNKTE